MGLDLAATLRFGLDFAFAFGFVFVFGFTFVLGLVFPFVLGCALIRPAVSEVLALTAAEKREGEVEKARYVDKLGTKGDRCSIIGAVDLNVTEGTRSAIDRVKDSIVTVNMVDGQTILS